MHTLRTHALYSPGAVRALLCLGVLLISDVAWAADICAHPLSGGGTCVRIFGTVSAVYALTASTYGLGAILIGKPRLSTKAFKLSLVLVPLVSWCAAMLGFTIGGMTGLLKYPHDSSPFFYVDWFACLVTFSITTVVVVLTYRFGAKQGS